MVEMIFVMRLVMGEIREKIFEMRPVTQVCRRLIMASVFGSASAIVSTVDPSAVSAAASGTTSSETFSAFSFGLISCSRTVSSAAGAGIGAGAATSVSLTGTASPLT